MIKPLSPAARAVLDAFLGDCEHTGLQMDDLRENVAAALRAVADQVVPITEEPAEPPGYGIGYEPTEYVQDWNRWHVRRQLRYKLLSIAAELEGSND